MRFIVGNPVHSRLESQVDKDSTNWPILLSFVRSQEHVYRQQFLKCFLTVIEVTNVASTMWFNNRSRLLMSRHSQVAATCQNIREVHARDCLSSSDKSWQIMCSSSGGKGTLIVVEARVE